MRKRFRALTKVIVLFDYPFLLGEKRNDIGYMFLTS
jgi:hypothetical protein